MEHTMLSWTLLIIFTTMSSSGGVSVASVPNGYATEQACQAAGKKAAHELDSLATTVRWSCTKSGAEQ